MALLSKVANLVLEVAASGSVVSIGTLSLR